MKLLLGSQSPRRREILSYFSLPFDVASSDFDEDSIPFTGDQQAYVKDLALAKAAVLADEHPGRWILTADTIVYRDGKVYGKPRDPEDGFRCLRELAGHTHSVYTAVTLVKDEEQLVDVEETLVHFLPLTDEQIRSYHAGLHCADKAGAYAIQGAGGIIVRGIEGCYYNVMGLPVQTVNQLLTKVGLSLWQHLGEA